MASMSERELLEITTEIIETIERNNKLREEILETRRRYVNKQERLLEMLKEKEEDSGI